MVSGKKFITLKGFDGFKDNLKITRNNITENFNHWTLDELETIKKDMIKKILLFEFSGDLRESLDIFPEFQTNDKVGWSLSANAEHASYNEFGVKEMTIYTYNKPSLFAWCEGIFGFAPNKITIGGTNSHIKLGASRNKFFFNTIEEYASENKTRVIGREVRKTINKYLRGK